MRLPPEHIEEYLNIAYVRAIAAKAGVVFSHSGPDYGVDGSIRWVKKINGKYHQTSWGFDCQLKATINWQQEPKNVIYDMKVEAYNKLIAWEGDIPCLLILFCLPKEPSDWLQCSEEELILRKCCYWTKITGLPTTNKSSIRIRIPRDQLLTPESIIELIERIKQGGV